jgi:hypothetical protein
MKKVFYIISSMVAVGVIAMVLTTGFGGRYGMMSAFAANSNQTSAPTTGYNQTTKTTSADNAAANLDGIAKATLNDGIQTVTTTLDNGVYAPIIVQKDIPVKWTITAQKGDINGCNGEMIIKNYNVDEKLKVGENVIQFTPTQSGTFTYSCWMGMVTSSIIVVDDINNITSQDISGYSGNTGLAAGSGCSMCNNINNQ